MVLASQASRSDVEGPAAVVPKKKSHKWLWALLVGAIVAAAGVGAYLYFGVVPSSWLSGDAAEAPKADELVADPNPIPAPPPPATMTFDVPRNSPAPVVAAAPAPAPQATAHSVSPTPAPTPATTVGANPLAAIPTTQPLATQPADPLAAPFRDGMALVDSGQLVEGRRKLSALLFAAEDQLSPVDAQSIREALNRANKTLVFSSAITPGDPLVEAYVVQSGEYLAKIAPKYKISYQFIEEINQISANRLRAGQRIKVLKGPLHVIVHKSTFTLDVFANSPTGEPLFVQSFTVGLGEDDSTPLGSFNVRNKVPNPGWTNPRTHETYAPNDPKNPIGEYWVGLASQDPTRKILGYGIHGTTEPQSIGQQMSMGCVRMRDEDIALVYKMLVERQSTIVIQP